MAHVLSRRPLIQVPHRRIGGWARTILAAGCAAIGVVYALVVPRGLPYDEPAHWANVLHVARSWTLPVVGMPDVSYEAQQAPLAYVLDAVVYRAVGGGTAGFYLVRLTGIAWLAVLSWTIASIARRHLPTASGWSIGCGVGVAVWNPMVVACAMSVQNDLPAVVLVTAALITAEGRPATAGALAGLAVLAKVSVVPAVVVVPLWLAWRRRDARAAALFGVVTAAVCGWWFVRNVARYGDVTGSAAVGRAGYSFPPLGLSIGTPAHLAREATTYLWLPVEYWRNTIHAGAVGLLPVAATLLIAGFGWRAWRPTLASLAGAACVGAWIVTSIFVQAVAFRTAYPALVAWALAATWAARRRVVGHLLLGALLVLHAWTLAAITA